MKKKNSPQINRSLQLTLVIALCAIAWLIGMSICNSITNGLTSIIMSWHQDDTYCTENDRVYQEIVSQMDSWIEIFPPTYHQLDSTYVMFEIPYLRRYIARSNYETSDNSLVIYVQTADTWPGRPEGRLGYLLIPSGASPSGDWDGRYTSTHLSGNIYCYEKIK